MQSNDTPKLAWILRSQRNFMIYSVFGFGLLSAVLLLWRIEVLRSPGLAIFTVIVSLGGGYLWGILMWKFFARERMERLHRLAVRNAHPASQAKPDA